MRKGGQKAKSYVHERAVGELFTKVYYPHDDGIFLRRDSVPGIRDKKMVPGDLVAFKYLSKDKEEMAIDKSFPFVIECKSWKDIKQFFSGLYSDESALFSWIEQVYEDSLYAKKIPIVVFKLYRQENIVELRSIDFDQLANLFGNFVGKIYTIEKIMPKKQIVAESIVVYQKLIFVLLEDFLEWIDWDVYKLGANIKFIRSLAK